ncbi:MAG: Hsp20/alpha crystallin family protein [Candidatus Hydrogenedentes bacterium]|nr:Hsp20/alpha crystallin family protein [Candidatus Hydrogenedentota bacterium]
MSAETKNVNECAAQDTRKVRQVRPAVDIYETDDSFHIVADIPGVEQPGVSLKIEGDQLHLDAAAKPSKAPVRRGGGEIRYTRSFRLGRQTDRDSIDARLEQGVLRVKLAKAQEVQPRQIEVRVGNGQSNN